MIDKTSSCFRGEGVGGGGRGRVEEGRAMTCTSEVQRVRLSRSSCIMRVLSLYDSSPSVSSSAMASSNAFFKEKKSHIQWTSEINLWFILTITSNYASTPNKITKNVLKQITNVILQWFRRLASFHLFSPHKHKQDNSEKKYKQFIISQHKSIKIWEILY